jgi:hypothetical protein
MSIRLDGAALFEDSVRSAFNVLEQNQGPALLTAPQAGLDIIIKGRFGEWSHYSNTRLYKVCCCSLQTDN